jgi:2-amino-4-hydroxy-6-hydroxymethyldihydropteridine diphosphokinase
MRAGGAGVARRAATREDGVADATSGTLAFVGLGSNQGDSTALLAMAVDGLRALPGTSVVACSSLYRTAAVGFEDQPDFLNQVVAVRTALAPMELLDAGQALETAAHRVRSVRWGPRTLDVDILWYDGITLGGERLTLPHPRLEERRFVLEPLAELAPEVPLPSGRTVAEALALVADQTVTRVPDEPGAAAAGGAVPRGAAASDPEHDEG